MIPESKPRTTMQATEIQFHVVNQMLLQENANKAIDVLHQGASTQSAADALARGWWPIDREAPFPTSAANRGVTDQSPETNLEILRACAAINVRLTNMQITIEELVAWAKAELLGRKQLMHARQMDQRNSRSHHDR